ncbi:MAG TPA: 50S ribosomal protein L25 [Acidimicrobiales bacterium]|nr:50S ribosomal protein L25 [Acidimicrobiales bacterium]
MAEINLSAEVGRKTGSSESRRLRRDGRIPAVVYGHGMEPLSVSVVARDLRTALSAHGLNQVLTLEVDGKSHLVLARQLQRHPVRHTVAHVDFQVVRSDEIVSAEVPLVVVGTATEVEMERGIIEHPITTLTVRSTPGHIPQQIEVDVTRLAVGGAIRVRDLRLPAGVTTEIDPDEAVVVAAAGRAEVEQEPEAASEGAGAEEGATEAGAGTGSGGRASEEA